MITTATTATTAITTMTAASLTLIVILALIALLVNKELLGGLKGERVKQLSRALNVAIIPLLVVFVTSVIFRVADTLR